MRKLFKISLAAFLACFLVSCSEDVMDNINKDVNHANTMATKLIVTDAMTSTAFNVVGSDMAFYASVYVEHNVGIWNQSYNAEIRSGEPTNSTTYDNSWSYIYNNLFNLKDVITKCSAGGVEEGNYVTLGVAEVLSAYNLAILTDAFGDAPWSEALQPGVIFQPKLDKQADIYTAIFAFLDDAIANFDKTTVFPSLGSQDFIYGGNATLWKKFAYGLKARYTMRLSFRDPKYADVVSFVDQSFASASEQAKFSYNGSTSNSPFYQFFTDRNYFGASLSLHTKLTDRSDPRDAVFFKAYPGTSSLIFAPNGAPSAVQGYYGVSAISVKTAPTYLLSYHELQFLKAEALVRLGGAANIASAETALKAGITAAFQKSNIGLTAAAANTYYTNNVKVKFDANPLSEVMIQKYIAFYEEEALEAYSDIRRLKAMGNDLITLSNTRNATQFPWRYGYGSSDVTTNANVHDAYGDGTYVYTEKVWWAGGTR
jgi:hypothetical protein